MARRFKAQDAFLAWNFVLALVLLFLVVRSFAPQGGVRASHRAWLPRQEVRVVPLAGSDDGRFRIDFGTHMVAPGEVGRLAKGAVRLVPEADVRCSWTSSSQLAVLPETRLVRATRYEVRLSPDLRALDGRRLAPDLVLDLVTNGVQVTSCVLDDEDETQPVPRLCLRLDLDVDEKELDRALRLRAPGGKPIDRRLQRLGEQPVFSITPAAPWPADTVVVEVDGSLRPRVGDQPMLATWRQEMTLVEPLRLVGVRGGDGFVALDFNRRLPLPAPLLVEVEPRIDFQMARDWSGVRLLGSFPPGQSVRVRLLPGFPGAGRLRLGEEVVRSVRMDDRRPLLRWLAGSGILSSRAAPELLVEGTNVERLRLRLRTAYCNNLVYLAQLRRRYDAPDNAFGPARSVELRLAARRNEVFRERLDLAALLGPARSGVHEVVVEDADGQAGEARCLLQITDLGLTARAAADAIAVRVASLALGTPVAGARLRVLTPTNQELCAGTTGPDGCALLPFLPSAADRSAFLVEARHGDDVTFLDVDEHGVELGSEALGGRPYLREGVEVWIHPDRGIVRPGEEARATLLVRDAHGLAPHGLPLEVRFRDPQGRLRRLERVETPGDGLLVARLATTPSFPTGSYEIEVWDPRLAKSVGSARFLVEAFVPDRLEAGLAAAGAWRLGGEGWVTVRGSWLAGGPAAGRAVKLFARYGQTSFTPEGWEGFSFAPAAGPREESEWAPGTQPPITSVLSEAGEAKLALSLPRPQPRWQCLRAELVAEVSDPSGRVVRATTSADVPRRDYLVGVQWRQGLARVALVTPEGKRFAPPTAVRVELVRRRYGWRYRPSARYGWETVVESHAVTSRPVEVAGEAAVDLPRPADAEWGSWYVLVARAGDAVAETLLDEAPRRPDTLRVTGPAVAVSPGSATRIGVEAPFSGRALVTIEGTSVHASQVADIQRGHNEIELRIPADLDLPSVHAVVTLRGQQAAKDSRAPWWLVGAAAIELQHASRTTAVGLEAPAEVRPGERLAVRVRALGASRAVIAVVDEGVRRLTQHPDPDPRGFFAARRRSEVRGIDSGTRLLEGPRFPEAMLAGGDDDGGEDVIEQRLAGTTVSLANLVLFAGPFDLGPSGEAVVELVLPESYEGRVRVHAIAAGEKATGAAACDVLVRAPLSLQVATPRRLSPGDEARSVVTLRNLSAQPGVVALSLALPDHLELVTPLPGEVGLAAQATAELALHLRARAPGRGRIELTGRLGDVERRVGVELAVAPAAIFDSEAIGIAAGPETTVPLPVGFLDGGRRAKLVLDGSPSARLLPALQSLMDYPYGCVEQTTSRCLALLACRSLVPRLLPEGESADVDDMLRTGIDRLLAMRTSSGGLSGWIGGRTDYDFGTCYGLDFLLSAKAAGLPVSVDELEAIAARVRSYLHDVRDPALRCYALELEARQGRPIAAWLAVLLPEARGEDRARLALAAARSGLPVDDLLAPAEVADARDTGGLLRSPLRAMALRLRALLAARPSDGEIPRLVEGLQRPLLAPGSLTTQEGAQALLALADYFARFAAPGEIQAEVRLLAQGREVRRWSLRNGQALALDVAQGDSLAIRASGRCYGTLVVSGFRSEAALGGFSGLTLERRVADAEGGEPAAVLRRGHVYDVTLAGSLERPVENLCLTDLVPAGCEIENPRLVPGFAERQGPDLEIRDDRILILPRGATGGRFELRYRVRAVFAGSFVWPGVLAESLYEPGRRAARPGGRIAIAE